jgi:hypothetical protein
MQISRRNRPAVAFAVSGAMALGVAGPVLAAQGHAKPRVTFTAPAAAATTGSKVVVKVRLVNFTIDAKGVGKANRASRGHLHFSMDNGKYDFPEYSGPNGKLAAQLGIAGKYSPAVAPTITYAKLPKGKHTLKVFLVNNDHSNTGTSATVRFTVK